MAALEKSALFPPELIPQLISRVRSKSAIANLCAAAPMPINGREEFVFNMDSEVSVVEESGKKPAASLVVTPKTIVPLKVVYQARVTDEFMRSSNEVRTSLLMSFNEGYASKLAKGLDLMAFHKVNPSTGQVSAHILSSFDTDVRNIVTMSSATNADQDVEAAIAMVEATGYDATGLAMSPTFRQQLASITINNGVRLYPGLAWGAEQTAMNGVSTQVSVAVSSCPQVTTDETTGNVTTVTDHAIVGDFASAFRYGIAVDTGLEIIEYGDPDGTGYDLKAYNQVMLRSETYLGFVVLDPNAFAIIRSSETTTP